MIRISDRVTSSRNTPFNVVIIANIILNIKFHALILSSQGYGLEQWLMPIIVAVERMKPKASYESEASLDYRKSSVPDWTSKWISDRTQPTKQANKGTLER